MGGVVFSSGRRTGIDQNQIVVLGRLPNGRLDGFEFIGDNEPTGRPSAPAFDLGGQDDAVVFDDLTWFDGCSGRF